MIESLERISVTGVRVEWSQPPGGATVTGYVVFYNDGSVTRNQTAPATATSAIITGLSNTVSYTISVMALSEQPDILPGRGHWKTITLGNHHNANTHTHKVDGKEGYTTTHTHASIN